MRRARYALTALFVVPLVACWNWNFSREPGLMPPDRPRVGNEPGGKLPEWMRNPPIREEELLETSDVHRAKREKSFTVVVRLGVPGHDLLADRSSIRIDIPVGHAGLPIGLAELAALAVVDTPDTAGDRPSLREWITELGGDLVVDVGTKRTRFTFHTPSAEWESVLDRVAERLRRTPITHAQLATLQHRLIRLLLDRWTSDPAFGYALQWSRFGDLRRPEIIGSIQDRHPSELMLFQRRHYQPDGTVVSVWVPEVSQPDSIVASTRFGLAAWQTAPEPSPESSEGRAAAEAAPNPTGVRWIEGPGRSRVAILIPNSSTALEWRVLMECLTMDGVGGRLGESLEDALDRELVFRARAIGSRFFVLETAVDPKSVPLVWKAMTQAWKSLGAAPPIGPELAGAKARLRLRLARRQDQTDEWLDAVGASRDDGGPIRDLHDLARIDHVRSVTQVWSKVELAMVVTGGTVPEDAPSTFTKVLVEKPEYRRTTEWTPAMAKETKRLLQLAVNAVGDERTLTACRGYELVETWKDAKGLAVRVSTTARPPTKMTRTTEVLGTRISTAVQQTGEELTGTETVGDETLELSTDEATELRDEANRYPLALLAGWVQGRIEFRQIGVRSWRNRKVALLERVNPTKSRLRITIDTKSGLLRTVETIRHRAKLGSVLVRESYDDYRRIGAYRVPMHRATQVRDGMDDVDSIDSVVTSFKVLDR